MSADLEFTDVAIDVAPPTTYEYSCEVCGTQLTYGGRGRKPKFCAEHRKSAPKSEGMSTRSGSTALGKQAAAALGQLNGIIATGMMLAPMPYRLNQTASALASANEGFVEAAASALSSDPALAKLILRGGAASGKVALIIAYGMLAGAVVPVAVTEYRENLDKADADRSASA